MNTTMRNLTNNVKQVLARLRRIEGSSELKEFIQNFTWLIFYVESDDSDEIHLLLTIYDVQASMDFNITGCTVHPSTIPQKDQAFIDAEDLSTLINFIECVRENYPTK